MSARPSSTPALAGVVYYALMASLGAYFAIAAMQGDYGLFRRLEIEAQITAMTAERVALDAEVARLTNLTQRLSDDGLDLDLLDERARAVLGLVHGAEIVLR